MAKFEVIGKHKIFLNERYFIAYAGGSRELPEKDQKNYNKILNLPFVLQRKELAKISFEKNPNVIPLTGSQLMSFIKELKFVPFFDQFFDKSHLLKLSDIVIYEAIRTRQYSTAMNTGE